MWDRYERSQARKCFLAPNLSSKAGQLVRKQMDSYLKLYLTLVNDYFNPV